MNQKLFFGIGGIVAIIGVYLFMSGISLLIQHFGSSISIYLEWAFVRLLVSIPFLFIGCFLIIIIYLKTKGKNT
ncbi:MAG: hypothetical protein ACFFBP_21890 [Promethearchaeota archaeon]